MKRTILTVLYVLLVCVACKNNEPGEKNAGTTIDKPSRIEAVPVGYITDGKFVVSDPEAVLEKWQNRLGSSLELSNPVIKEGKVASTGETYYIMVSESKDNTFKAACLLLVDQENKFFFDIKGEGYLLVTCEGKCNEGCDIDVFSVEGEKVVVCSECPDCTKTDIEIR